MSKHNSSIEKKIFISYAREDQNIALRLYRDLISVGLNPWIDKENLLPGQDWKQTITKAIGESSYFIALLSTNSISKKGYIQKELRIAIDVWSELPPSTIFIIPVRLEECEPLNDELRHLHWADLFPSYQNGLEKILQVLQPEKVEEDQPETQGESSSEQPTLKSIDFGDAPPLSNFFGRENELSLLENLIVKDKCRVVGITGIGGIGKSALALKFAENVKDKFDYILWKSFLNAPPPEVIVQDILQFLSPNTPLDSYSLDQQLDLLLNHLKSNRCLIIFDSIETIIKSGEMSGYYRDGYESYRRIFVSLAENSHNSCVIFTSRIKPLELSVLEGKNRPIFILNLGGLSVAAGKQIFAELSITGTTDEIKNTITIYSGNPLALKLAGHTIREIFNNDIGLFLKKDNIPVDMRDLLEYEFNKLSDVEKEVVYRIGIHRDSLSLSKLLRDSKSTSSENQILEAIQSLIRKSMIFQDDNGFSLPSVLIEYINQRLIEKIAI